MRILMLIDGLGIGGAETHVLTLTGALHRAGEEVTVVSFGGELEATLRARGVEHLRYPAPMSSAFGCLRNFLFLRRLVRRRQFDVIHAHTRRCALLLRFLPRLSLGTDGGRWPCYRKRGVRRALAPLRVVTAHAAFSPRFSRLSYWGEATLAVSEDIRVHLQRHFKVKHPIRVLPNGVELSDLLPPMREDGTFSVAFASRMDTDCSLGASLLLSVADELAARAAACGLHLRLYLIGGGDAFAGLAAQREALLRASSRLRAADIVMSGSVRDPSALFRRCHAFVGVSRAALEALGCGCAVVLAGNEGYGGPLTPQNFDEHAATNFCCRGGEAASANALLRDLTALLRTDQARLATQARALRAMLQKRYDVNVQAERTLRCYRQALAQKRQLRVVCAGYFGQGNLGDEAILRCLLRRFQGATAPRSLADAPWYCAERAQGWTPHTCRSRRGAAYHARRCLPHMRLPSYGRFTTAQAPSVATVISSLRLQLRVVDRRRVLAAFAQFGKADALLLGGGSLLQNGSRHGSLSLLYYLGLCVAARLLGCPFSLRANGIGPLQGFWAKWAVGAVLRQAAGISLRDADSRHLLLRLGVPRERMTLLEDGVAAWRARCSLPVRRGAYVCICPRGGDLSAMQQLLSMAHRYAPGCPRVYVALDAVEDVVGCAVLCACEGGRMICPRSEMEAAMLLGGAVAVISMRLHGLILAGKEPGLLALATDATVDKLSAEIGCESVEKINKKFQKRAIQTKRNIV